MGGSGKPSCVESVKKALDVLRISRDEFGRQFFENDWATS
jgi:hypothetical protein